MSDFNNSQTPSLAQLKVKFLGKRDGNTFVRQQAPASADNAQKVKDMEVLIARELPGYHLVKKTTLSPQQSDVDAYIEELNQIVEHDMPGWKLAESSKKAMRKSVDYAQMHSIRVQPANGGPEKVAGVQNGKIVMVQG